MFYGTYYAGNGDIYANYANSNNYTIAVSGTDVRITFNQWTYYRPTVSVSPAVSSTDPAMACSCWVNRSSESDPWVATVKSYVLRNGVQTASNKNFSFRGQCGMRRIFTAQDLTLTPRIIDFQGSKVLAMRTTIGGETVYLDKGTMLIGVGRSMKLQLGETSVSDDNGNTWALTGWTYDGSNTSGEQWPASGFELTTDPEGSGPATTPYLFAIKGIRSRGNGQQYISSDPVVRLSSVPPGGISL